LCAGYQGIRPEIEMGMLLFGLKKISRCLRAIREHLRLASVHDMKNEPITFDFFCFEFQGGPLSLVL
jgi:hypothetical protein